MAPEGQKKKPAASYSRAGGSRTTLGEEALDFRVRDGNGYDSLSMATGRKPFRLELKRNATRRGGSPHLSEVRVFFGSRRTLSPGGEKLSLTTD